MLRKKVDHGGKRKKWRSLKNQWLLVFILTLIFLPSKSFKLLANTEKAVSFSLNLEEWLILEVISDNFQVSDIGHRQAQVETTIIPDQPVFIRAFLAIRPGKKVVLKTILFPLEKTDAESCLQLKWQGEGDLAGGGLINLYESTALATWQNQGLKTGSINFENIYENSLFPLKGVFTLISY